MGQRRHPCLPQHVRGPPLQIQCFTQQNQLVHWIQPRLGTNHCPCRTQDRYGLIGLPPHHVLTPAHDVVHVHQDRNSNQSCKCNKPLRNLLAQHGAEAPESHDAPAMPNAPQKSPRRTRDQNQLLRSVWQQYSSSPPPHPAPSRSSTSHTLQYAGAVDDTSGKEKPRPSQNFHRREAKMVRLLHSRRIYSNQINYKAALLQ